LSIKARENETRISSILIENNMPDAVTITPAVDPWRDALGHPVNGSEIEFDPLSLHLETRGSGTITATTEIDPANLQGGNIYYTQIRLEGSRAKPLSVSLTVVRAARHDVFVKTDPCRSQTMRWVEVCCEPDDPWWQCCQECGRSPCCCGSRKKAHRWWELCEWHPLSGIH
jgi:hypothetical protein